MPYGLEDETPNQTKWMEKCVKSVMKSNPDYEKDRAIAICKAQIKKNKGKSEEWMDEATSETGLREVEDMFYKALNEDNISQPSSYAYPVDIFDDYAIISKGDKHFKVPYTISDSEVNVSWEKAIEVVRKVTYEKASSDEVVTYVTKHTRVRGRITNGTRTV